MLVCPLCKGKLKLDNEAGELLCTFDGLAYPLQDGVPVMLESEARRMSEEEKLAKAVEAEPTWLERKELLESVPGVGKALIWTLLSEMPELGSLNNKQVSALAGLAPINRDSGKSQGKRRIQGGRYSVRTTLYMATLSATQCNPIIGSFYRHLVKQGKHKKVALTAAMRKFLTILNAMIRDGQEWSYE